MGRSASCFKLISCGSDSVEESEATDVPQTKRSGDRKGWSFRKRSEQHRVLSNTVIQEASSGLKEIPESASYVQQSAVSTAPEKTVTIQYTEEKPQWPTPKDCVEEKSQLVAKEYTETKSQLLTPEDSKVLEPVVATTNVVKDDPNMDESVVIAIQTAIRGFLAHKELAKLKNLVKLQAAVRGHLVRRHAVGTLRCVQAIIKMQVLVRARLSQQGSYAGTKPDGLDHKESQSSGNSTINKNASSTSIEKLLSNRFARLLMDSTPRTKPIHISSDQSKSSSSWSWLERWMSASSSGKASIAEVPIEKPGKEKSHNCDLPLDDKFPSEAISESNDPKCDVTKALVSSGSEENLITYDAANSELEACQPTSSVTGDLEQSQIDIMGASDVKGTSLDQTMETDTHSQTEASCLSNKPEILSEQPKHSIKGVASEQLETEAKKFVSGSRKASDSEFLELSSTANSSRSIDSSSEDVRVESNLSTVPSGVDTISRSKEPSITENPVNNLRGQHCGSEFGTELSATLTLDSPDRSEVGTIGCENGAKASEQQNYSSNHAKDLDVKDNDKFAIPMPGSSLPAASQPEKLEDTKGESENLVVDSLRVEQEPICNLLSGQDSEKGNKACRSSPEASPRSHMTVPDSQGTPSSQVSVKTKKKKTDKSSQKRKSPSTAKGSISTSTHDSGARRSMEQSPRDKKSGKWRNSFGSTRPENINEEPRDSNGSNSVPRFMQATESTRAKVNANNSPRSSPDVQDRDMNIKKRHSLPGASGKQTSPRVQPSSSQAQQGATANGTNPLNDRKWQR